VGLAGSGGVWLVTGVLAMEPFLGVWSLLLEGEPAVELLLLCDIAPPPSVEPGCCSIAIKCG
jgi:hypothetical protein